MRLIGPQLSSSFGVNTACTRLQNSKPNTTSKVSFRGVTLYVSFCYMMDNILSKLVDSHACTLFPSVKIMVIFSTVQGWGEKIRARAKYYMESPNWKLYSQEWNLLFLFLIDISIPGPMENSPIFLLPFNWPAAVLLIIWVQAWSCAVQVVFRIP